MEMESGGETEVTGAGGRQGEKALGRQGETRERGGDTSDPGGDTADTAGISSKLSSLGREGLDRPKPRCFFSAA